MSKPAIRIDTIPVHELEAFADRARNEKGVVPITPRRARSHAANPNAVPDEIALLVAYDGDCCIGFLGIMAGVIRAGGESQRMHWFSSWYVDPDQATSGAGTMLLMRAIGLKYDLAVTGTSPEADDMYRAMRFKEIGPLEYEEVFMDMLDPLGFPFFAVGKWLEKRGKSAKIPYAIADVLRPFLQPLLKRIVYALTTPAMPSNVVGRVAQSFENDSQATTEARFERNAATVNWMLAHPWFAENEDDAVSGYYFGDVRPIFRYIATSLEREGVEIGNAVVLASRKSGRTTVKLLDYSFKNDEDSPVLVRHVLEVASRYKADRILLPAAFKQALRQQTVFGRITFSRTRTYFCRPKKKNSTLSPLLDQVKLQLTDGDCAFS